MSGSSATTWTVAHQAPLSAGFPRQEYWSGLLFPSPGALLDSEIKLASPAQAGGFFTTEPPANAERQGGGPRPGQQVCSYTCRPGGGEERELWEGLLHGSLPTFRLHPWTLEKPFPPLVLVLLPSLTRLCRNKLPPCCPRSHQLSHACVVCSSVLTIFLTISICPSEDHSRATDPVL